MYVRIVSEIAFIEVWGPDSRFEIVGKSVRLFRQANEISVAFAVAI
jgi:hypothetical protein